MKAILRTRYGSPDVIHIGEIPKPSPQPGHLVVRVHAATISRTDSGVLTGLPWVFRFFAGLFKPRYPVLGTDFAGVVAEVGAGVQRFQPGDRVFGFVDTGLATYAEYVLLKENTPMALIPDGYSFDQAAASAEGLHYAVNTVNKSPIQAGQRVLVNGATGAIGSALVQLSKYYGAHVVAVCQGQHFEAVRALGADRLVDYTLGDFTTRETETYDFVYDAVGKSRFRKCKPLLRPRGVYISSELGPNWENIFLAMWTPLFSRKKVIFPVPSNIQASLDIVCKMIAEGKFHPLIDKVVAMEEVAETFKYVMAGKKVGNVIVRIGPAD